MISLQQAFYALKQELLRLYDEGEATAITHEVLEHLTGLGRLKRLSEKDSLLNAGQYAAFEDAKHRLLEGEPLQYITEVQWFLGRPFQVGRQVLIPRPETEELVQWIAEENSSQKPLSVLDIGTGSGCIAISLKLLLPAANVTACDISEQALELAAANEQKFGAHINFLQLDFLDEIKRSQLGLFDVIVSNPPYIPVSEKEQLHRNVVAFEPHVALFVPDGDPLLFYRHIATFAKTHLLKGGAVFCELHRDHATVTATLFKDLGYSIVELKEDMHGNPRMLRASQPL